jgi:Holliday junction resolvase
MTNYAQRGRQRERQVADHLRDRDWICLKGTSFGAADLVALKAGELPWMIEVKSTAGGPYEQFRKDDRAALSAVADMAGARAVLAWWPPRGELRFIHSHEWPTHTTEEQQAA